MSSKDVRFMVEIPNTGDVNQYVAAMLVRECTSFVTTFAGEWTKNIGLIEEEGFKVTDEGQLVCTKRHFKKDSENLGLFTDFENILAVGQAIMTHNINVTHMDEERPKTIRTAPSEFRNGSTCGPDCPSHAHNHYRKMT